VIGNIIAGTAKSLPQLVAGRLISGVGGAGLLSLSTIILSQLTHERQRGSYLNLINFVFLVSDSLGPILGGLLARGGNWRWIFLFNTPFAPLITAVLIFAVHLQPSKSSFNGIRGAIKSLDAVGMMMIVTSLSLLIVALNLGGDAFLWNASVTIGLFVGSAVSFVLFIVSERHAAYPVVPMSLFGMIKFRNVPIMTVHRTLLFFHIFASTFYLPIFLQVTGRTSVLAAALVVPFCLLAGVASTITNLITSKYGHVRLAFMATLAVLPVGMGLMSTLTAKSSIGQVVGYSLISGFGFGCGTQLTMVIAQVGLSNDLLPTVTAFISATPNLGGVLGVAIVGTVVNTVFRSNLSKSLVGISTIPHINDAVVASKDPIIGQQVVDAYVSAFRVGFRILAGVAVLQFLLCLGLGRVELTGGTRKERGVCEEEAAEGRLGFGNNEKGEAGIGVKGA